jgi:acetyl esterase
MHVDPVLIRLMASQPAVPPPDPDDIAERCRRNNESLAAFRPSPQEGVRRTEHMVDVAGGQIAVRAYRPQSDEDRLPALLYFHGGGWHMGNLDSAEAECVFQAADIPAALFFVDYRLAPEHPYPVPLDDCVAAYRWVVDQADELGVDPARVAVGGTSAGANLAAALCLRVRDEGGPLPCVQLLDVPCLDLTLASPSLAEFADGFGITSEQVAVLVALYLRQPSDAQLPYVSPLLADDLHGLPPALIVVAELDPVRDDGERYLQRLHEAGVEAATLRVLAHLHQTWMVPGSLSWSVVRDVHLATLRRAFAGTLVPVPVS